MQIQFSKEEKAIGSAVASIVENAPTAVAKTGVSVVGTGLSLGWGLSKAVFGAGKVLVNSAMDGITAAQIKMQQAQLEALAKAQAEAAKKAQQEQNTIEAEVIAG